MAEQKITITVSPDGQSKIEAEGFTGQSCMDATAIFEAGFSKTAKAREMVEVGNGRKPDDGERVR
jgi:hypothetical protein